MFRAADFGRVGEDLQRIESPTAILKSPVASPPFSDPDGMTVLKAGGQEDEIKRKRHSPEQIVKHLRDADGEGRGCPIFRHLPELVSDQCFRPNRVLPDAWVWPQRDIGIDQ